MRMRSKILGTDLEETLDIDRYWATVDVCWFSAFPPSGNEADGGRRGTNVGLSVKFTLMRASILRNAVELFIQFLKILVSEVSQYLPQTMERRYQQAVC